MKFVLTPTDVIESAGVLVALITGIIAIVISIKTLKQNSKMIEESSRPNIQIYPVYINSYVYLIIKNFGASEAYLDKISCSHKFTREETLGDDLGTDIFDRIQGALFSPGYSIKCPLVGHELTNEVFDFYIRYYSASKTYENTFSFNPLANVPFADLYPSSKTVEGNLSNISKELRDIVKANL